MPQAILTDFERGALGVHQTGVAVPEGMQADALNNSLLDTECLQEGFELFLHHLAPAGSPPGGPGERRNTRGRLFLGLRMAPETRSVGWGDAWLGTGGTLAAAPANG
jgi:hypothetical protein